MDHIIKIKFTNDDKIIVVYNDGINWDSECLKKGSNEYDEMFAYMQTQKVMDSGEIVSMLKELKAKRIESI